MDTTEKTERIKKIREQIADLESNWPAHSPKPSLLLQIEELEAELEAELEELTQDNYKA